MKMIKINDWKIGLTKIRRKINVELLKRLTEGASRLSVNINRFHVYVYVN